MNLDRGTVGHNLPGEFNAIIELPMHADPIKYEVDKKTGAVFVHRFMMTAMCYPCNYGCIPRTLWEDGDPGGRAGDHSFPGQRGRGPIGLLSMVDEAGGMLPMYKHWRKPEDLQLERLAQIQHFFEHYKDLEPGKWVKVAGWLGAQQACDEIMSSLTRYDEARPKPIFSPAADTARQEPARRDEILRWRRTRESSGVHFKL